MAIKKNWKNEKLLAIKNKNIIIIAKIAKMLNAINLNSKYN